MMVKDQMGDKGMQRRKRIERGDWNIRREEDHWKVQAERIKG